MCVPCAKQLINDGATAAAEAANTIRYLVVDLAERENRNLSKPEEALLLRMAQHEAQFIKAIRQCRTQMIAVQGSPEEWVNLARGLE